MWKSARAPACTSVRSRRPASTACPTRRLRSTPGWRWQQAVTSSTWPTRCCRTPGPAWRHGHAATCRATASSSCPRRWPPAAWHPVSHSPSSASRRSPRSPLTAIPSPATRCGSTRPMGSQRSGASVAGASSGRSSWSAPASTRGCCRPPSNPTAWAPWPVPAPCPGPRAHGCGSWPMIRPAPPLSSARRGRRRASVSSGRHRRPIAGP